MQIKKVYIQNFKGIRKKAVIDLTGTPLTILNGPNGFGKTTIFDVIELCLRGRLARADKYEGITKHTADYYKAFYQNDTSEDVILKICLSDGNIDHVIIKRLDKDSEGRTDGGRRFRADAWQLFETYYTNNLTGFEESPNFPGLQQITQQYIDQLFFPGQGISLVNLFPLFHYLQQEENIYFLKMNEVEKKESLNFLFQTQQASQEYNRAFKVANGLAITKSALQRRIGEIGLTTNESQTTSYKKLISWRIQNWDQEDPFQNAPTTRLPATFEEYRTHIQNLINFAKAFDLAEYTKLQTRNALQEILRSEWLINTLVIYNLLASEKLAQLRRQHELNRSYKKYRDDFTHYMIDESIMTAFNYSADQLKSIQTVFAQRQGLGEQTTSLSDIMRDLNDARDRVMGQFLELRRHGHIENDTNCPLCNAQWENMDTLMASYDFKTDQMQNLLNGQERLRIELDNKIENETIKPLQAKIDSYLIAPEHAIDDAFYAHVIERAGNYTTATTWLKFFQDHQYDISDFQISTNTTVDAINAQADLLRQHLQQLVFSISVDESKVQNGSIYRDYYQSITSNILGEEALTQKLAYITEQYDVGRLTTVRKLNERLDRVTAALVSAERVRSQLEKVIFDYKKAMIEKIKIPFYIYSGKILQHFQQGYGIFVDVRENTNRIRFLADQTSNHDAIHQLSTGQLAVVSIAFCLALNKVYTLPSHFKFLAIDDPVQTLDDINIYSLVDLIRHEFNDWQLLISTHDENVANFLKYKFDKFSMPATKLNVQATFYESQSAD